MFSKLNPAITSIGIALVGMILSVSVAWGSMSLGSQRDHSHLLDIENRTRILEQTVPVISDSLKYLEKGQDELNRKWDRHFND